MNVGGDSRVSMKVARGYVSWVVLGAALLVLSGVSGCDYESSLDGLECNDDEECPEGALCDDGFCIDAPDPQYVELSPDEPTVIDKEEGFVVEAAVYDEAGERFGGVVDYQWTVAGDDAVVSLDDADGSEVFVVGGQQAGTALVRVEVEGLEAVLPVTVSATEVDEVVVEAADGIDVGDDDAWTIDEGADGRLEARVFGERDGEQVALENRLVRWESSNPSVLTVDSDGRLYAERTTSESVEITARAGAGDVSSTVSIEVRDRRIDQVAIIPGDLQMAAGQQVALSATAFSAGERIERGLDEFDWDVSGEGVTDIEVDGDEVVVTADDDLGGDDLKVATVEAILDDGMDSIEIRVVEQLDDGINISPSIMELREGQTARLAGTVVEDGVIQTGAELQWTIDTGADVLDIVGDDVGEEVEVEALTSGQATVSAEKPGSALAPATAEVSVEPAPIIALSIEPSFAELVVGSGEPDEVDVAIELTTLAEETLDAAAIEDDPNIDGEDIEFTAGPLVDVVRTGTATATLKTTGDEGSTELTVSFDDYGVDDTIGVVVAPEAVEDVDIDQGDQSMQIGDDVTLSATVTPDIVGYAEEIVWWSGDDSVVTAGADDLAQGSDVSIEAVGAGETTITAFVDGQYDAIEVTVTVDFDIAGNDAVDLGETTDLSAVFNGSPVTTDVTWGSDDSDVASVDQSGTVTGVGEGSTTIYAAYQGEKAETPMAVNNPYEVIIEGASGDPLAIGESMPLSATVDGADQGECFDGDIVWTSDDPSVASVDSDGTIDANGVGEANIVAHCGPVESEPELVQVSPPQISIDGAPFEVELGDEKPIEAHIDYQGNCQPVWTSDKPEAVGVESLGDNAVLFGKEETDTPVEIRVYCGESSEPADVTVINPYDVDIDVFDNQMEVGDVEPFELDDSGNPCPSSMTEWTSSNPDVAVVDGDGVVAAVGSGEAEIEAHCGDESDLVEVEVYELVGVDVDQPDQKVDLGDEGTLTAQIDYDGPNTYADACVAQWTSSDSGVVTVSSTSITGDTASFQADDIGEATITVECGGLDDSIEVTVQYGEAIEITSPDDEVGPFRMEVGDTEAVEAEVAGGPAAVNCDVPLEWSSSDPAVASVDSSGVIEAVSGHEVTATITVECGYASDDVDIEVISEPDALAIECDADAETAGDCEADPGPPNDDVDFILDRQNGALTSVVEYDGEDFEGCTPFWSAETTAGGGATEINQDGEINASSDADEAQITVSCGAEDETVDVRLQEM